jgi:hypothetical protein
MNSRRTLVAAAPPHERRRWAAIGATAVCVFGVGVALGSKHSSPDPARTVTVATPAAPFAATARPAHPAGVARTAAGAAAAAAVAVSSLDGAVLLDRSRLRALVSSLATDAARPRLIEAYEQAALSVRARLGVGSVPPPVVFVRAIPIGYRVDAFTPKEVTVSVWRVGIVGSGATVPPQQSWRTEIVSLVWEHARWRIAGFASEPGPTPPLGATATSSATDLFASVPRFKEFTSANP